jgi:hypothetical protein
MRDDRLAVRERLIMRERVRATKLTKTNPERIPRSPQRPTPRASATDTTSVPQLLDAAPRGSSSRFKLTPGRKPLCPGPVG